MLTGKRTTEEWFLKMPLLRGDPSSPHRELADREAADGM